MTDKSRVLAFLHAAGPDGITQWQMHRPPDNGKPIERLAARVLDLKNDGEQIVPIPHKVGRSRVARYVHRDYLEAPEFRTEQGGQLALIERPAA